MSVFTLVREAIFGLALGCVLLGALICPRYTVGQPPEQEP